MVSRRFGEGERTGSPSPAGTPNSGEFTVLVVDDHAGYRAGLSRAIEAWNGLRLVGEAADGSSALRAIEAQEPDLALVDVRMPGMNGLELCSEVESQHHTQVVLLSAFMDERLASQAEACGAAACMSKDTPRAQICRRLVAVGRTAGRAGTRHQ